jgi:hypothetical protein
MLGIGEISSTLDTKTEVFMVFSLEIVGLAQSSARCPLIERKNRCAQSGVYGKELEPLGYFFGSKS